MEDGTDYLTLPAWEGLGQILGVFAIIESTERVEGGWKARAVAKAVPDPPGVVIGAAPASVRVPGGYSYEDKMMPPTLVAMNAPLAYGVPRTALHRRKIGVLVSVVRSPITSIVSSALPEPNPVFWRSVPAATKLQPMVPWL